METINKAQDWWFYRSPLTKQQLQIKYFPATNFNYLSQTQIKFIYDKEKQQNFRYQNS